MTTFSHGLGLVAVLVGLSAGCGREASTPAVTTSPPTEGGKAIASVSVEPSKATMGKGSTLKLRATARYADGSTADVSGDVVWNTSDPNVATVTKDGLVTAVKTGYADITANYKGVSGHERFVVTP